MACGWQYTLASNIYTPLSNLCGQEGATANVGGIIAAMNLAASLFVLIAATVSVLSIEINFPSLRLAIASGMVAYIFLLIASLAAMLPWFLPGLAPLLFLVGSIEVAVSVVVCSATVVILSTYSALRHRQHRSLLYPINVSGLDLQPSTTAVSANSNASQTRQVNCHSRCEI
ncbi:hypothetical protein CPB83DRAFT_895793 [Crepidotus variabilis]|uniref:Transmembrane protein n=1 Tax=Crepidotus variabilis TaxID=179855 RepID=A0A9P6ED31_9AGAR|nr:hypothetical protein CPB83DRAFT_895793 [Crepidotus variabilis]